MRLFGQIKGAHNFYVALCSFIMLRSLCTITHIGWYRWCPSCRCISLIENAFRADVRRRMAVNQYINGSLLPCITVPAVSVVSCLHFLHFQLFLALFQ